MKTDIRIRDKIILIERTIENLKLNNKSGGLTDEIHCYKRMIELLKWVLN